VTQIPTAAVRDTVAAVFRQYAYDRSIKDTLLNRFLGWVARLIERARDAAADSPALYWASVAILTTLVLLVVARVVYLAYARRSGPALTRGTRAAGGGRGRDPWAEAQELSAAGRFTEAAHALYAALLERLARRERLRLHPSKTAGDYARSLRARGSPAYAPFREFVRVYDVVVYGLGHCDRDRYERLTRLAAPLLAAGDAPAAARRAG
jgi:hypothetical protein